MNSSLIISKTLAARLPKNPNCCSYYETDRRPWRPNVWRGLVYICRTNVSSLANRWKTSNEKSVRNVVSSRSVTHSRSASLESVNIHRSSGNFSFSVSTTVLIALPTSPDPPVTRITLAIPDKWRHTHTR